MHFSLMREKLTHLSSLRTYVQSGVRRCVAGARRNCPSVVEISVSPLFYTLVTQDDCHDAGRCGGCVSAGEEGLEWRGVHASRQVAACNGRESLTLSQTHKQTVREKDRDEERGTGEETPECISHTERRMTGCRPVSLMSSPGILLLLSLVSFISSCCCCRRRLLPSAPIVNGHKKVRGISVSLYLDSRREQVKSEGVVCRLVM